MITAEDWYFDLGQLAAALASVGESREDRINRLVASTYLFGPTPYVDLLSIAAVHVDSLVLRR